MSSPAPSPRDVQAVRDRMRAEIRGTVLALLRSLPESYAEWFVGEVLGIYEEVEAMLWQPELATYQPPPVKPHVCAICRHPQVETVLRPYFGHLCNSCDRPGFPRAYDREDLAEWERICSGRAA